MTQYEGKIKQEKTYDNICNDYVYVMSNRNLLLKKINYNLVFFGMYKVKLIIIINRFSVLGALLYLPNPACF
jgi:hypothetical protein